MADLVEADGGVPCTWGEFEFDVGVEFELLDDERVRLFGRSFRFSRLDALNALRRDLDSLTLVAGWIDDRDCDCCSERVDDEAVCCSNVVVDTSEPLWQVEDEADEDTCALSFVEL